jgi:hypothetical protein
VDLQALDLYEVAVSAHWDCVGRRRSGHIDLMFLLAFPIGFAIAGAVIGRLWVVLAAMVTWGALGIYLVANNGWYGHGWGEFGVAFNVIAAVATVLAAAVGVGVRRVATRTEGGSPARVV